MQTTLYPAREIRPRLRRTAFDLIGLWLLLALLAALNLPAAWQFWHANRVFTGVSVGGVPIGGLTRAEALKKLNGQLYAYPLPPVVVDYNGQQWPLQTAQAGARADLLAAVNQAYLVGRGCGRRCLAGRSRRRWTLRPNRWRRPSHPLPPP